MLAGLLSIEPASTREQVSHVLIDQAGVASVHARDGRRLGGGQMTLNNLEDQVQLLSDTGIFGGASIETNGHGFTITLHASNQEERAAWENRMHHAEQHHCGIELLGAAARLRLTQWHRDEAMLEVQRQVWAAADAGVPKTVIADLSGVARKTVYEILKTERPRVDVAPAPEQPQSQPAASEPLPTTPTDQSRPAITSEDLIRLPVGHTQPCVMCSTPTNYVTAAGEALHTAACLQFYVQGFPTREPSTANPAPSSAAAEPSQSATVIPPPPIRPPRQQAQADATGVAATPQTTRRPVKPASKAPSRSRFAAAAAAWDGTQLYLPGGTTQPFDPPVHIGEVALLAHTHRLGHGGGAALPDRGEIWLYPGALEVLGLPIEVALPALGSPKERRQARDEAFGALSNLTAIERAIEDGWVLDRDRVDARTRIRHPNLLPVGAHLVMIPWSDFTGMPLLVEGTETAEQMATLVEPAVLVDRLQEFADLTGITWRVTAAETGVDLVDVTRPPLREGESAGAKAALIRGETPDLPQFLSPRARRGDARFATDFERVFSWWRPWESLMDEEKARKYVIAFDHSGHFLGPYTSTQLGLRGVEQLTGEAARWDGSERPGYWAVSRWEPPSWMFPDPAAASGTAIDQDKILVTAHTLKQLDMITPGFTSSLTYHWAWVWTETARYLEPAGERLKKARQEGSQPVADTVKQIYSHMTQKLASLDSPPPQLHLRRPDWRDHLVAAARSALLRTVVNIQQTTGAIPLVVDRDTVIYAVDTDDPTEAWPGDPRKYGWGQGQWKPDSIALLEEWGPAALPTRKPGSLSRWDYANVTKRMTKIHGERN